MKAEKLLKVYSVRFMVWKIIKYFKKCAVVVIILFCCLGIVLWSQFFIWPHCEATMANQIPVNVEFDHDEILDNIMPPDVSGLSLLLVELMSEDKNVVQMALKEMADLCTLSNTNREANCKGIAYSMIISAMIKWYRNPDIQTAGCEVLANATYEPCHIDIKTIIMDFEGPSVIHTAKRNYPNDTELECLAITVLTNLDYYAETWL